MIALTETRVATLETMVDAVGTMVFLWITLLSLAMTREEGFAKMVETIETGVGKAMTEVGGLETMVEWTEKSLFEIFTYIVSCLKTYSIPIFVILLFIIFLYFCTLKI
ncbi:MAG: hypothetical protein LBR28_02230 [Bacteroidales bacterium]|jgi:hypothetical protein|nr:hypothetical protein [Bacteroidales bacterium]